MKVRCVLSCESHVYNVRFMTRGQVSIFVTCIVDQLFPRVGIAMAEVLERDRLGRGVSRTPDVLRAARVQLRLSRRGAASGAALPRSLPRCGTHCGAVRLVHVDDLAPFCGAFRRRSRSPGRRPACGQRTWEFSRFLLEVAGVEDVGARFDGIVTYHDSCHALRELHIQDGPRRLLANVRGPGAARDGHRGGVLRLRRHVLGEIRGSVGRDGAHQDRFHPCGPARAPWCPSIPVA